MCAARQREILQAVWPRLRPGGCLIYSTCTFNTAENEENIAWIASHLGAEVLSVDTENILGKSFSDLGITPSLKGDLPAARFMFHRSRGEGLFMALLQKHPSQDTQQRASKLSVKTVKMPPMAAQLLRDAQAYHCVEVGGRYHAMSAEVLAVYDALAKSKVRMHQAGIALGEIKGKDFIPDAALALSTALNKEAVPMANLDKEMALSYLRREAVLPNANLERGYVLLQYESLPLGWIKHLGNRANNLYPNEWRIRKV